MSGVSFIAVIRDEEKTLPGMLRSILAQDFAGPLEVLLAVGPSHDDTLAVAQKWAIDDPRVRVIDNPSGGRADGLNAALHASRHEVLIRVDGHAELPRAYVRLAVQELERTGAVNVGGMMVPVGIRATQRAVARAMSHPAGIGAERFHTGGEAGPAATVYLGAFRRDAVIAAGGYDQSLVRGEDWDLNRRLREAGGTVWFDPRLQVSYYPRATLRAVALQFWRTGMWRREIVKRHPHTANLRYLAPPVLVLGLAASLVVGVVGLILGSGWGWLGAVLPGAYLLAVLAASVHAGWRDGPAVLSRLPGVLITMHLTWGAGFLRGVSRRAARDHRA